MDVLSTADGSAQAVRDAAQAANGAEAGLALERELDRLNAAIAAHSSASASHLQWTLLAQAFLLAAYLIVLVGAWSLPLPGKRWLLAAIAVYGAGRVGSQVAPAEAASAAPPEAGGHGVVEAGEPAAAEDHGVEAESAERVRQGMETGATGSDDGHARKPRHGQGEGLGFQAGREGRTQTYAREEVGPSAGTE